MEKLNQAIDAYSREFQKSRENLRVGMEHHDSANSLFSEAKKLRLQELQNTLESQGLAICSRLHSDCEEENIENPTASQLGIFPRDEMRLRYYKNGPREVEHGYHMTWKTDESLDLLCPEHFPHDREWSSFSEDGYTLIDSEVVKQGDKYILAVDGFDVTDLVKDGGKGFELNGMSLFIVKDPVYRYFGIQDLPEEPKYPSLLRINLGWDE